MCAGVRRHQWTTQPMTLRTYFYPSAPGSSQLTWSTPGATLRVRRATTPTSGDGDELKDPARHAAPGAVDPGQPVRRDVPSGSNACPPPGQPCPSTCTKGCSPRRPSPSASTATTPPTSTSTAPTSRRRRRRTTCCWSCGRSRRRPARRRPAYPRPRRLAYGQYQYDVDPCRRPRPRAPTGTTRTSTARCRCRSPTAWPGALIIEGPFDDWLRGCYPGGKLVEKLSSSSRSSGHQPLHDRRRSRRRPWSTARSARRSRCSRARCSAGASSTPRCRCPASDRLRSLPRRRAGPQIAMDGVRFAPENYGSPAALALEPVQFDISPGNRADFLVAGPGARGAVPSPPASPVVRRQEGQGRPARRGAPEARSRRPTACERRSARAPSPPLVTLVVAAKGQGRGHRPGRQGRPRHRFRGRRGQEPVRNKARQTLLFEMTGGPAIRPQSSHQRQAVQPQLRQRHHPAEHDRSGSSRTARRPGPPVPHPHQPVPARRAGP